MYRQMLALVLRELRPRAEVILAAPESLDGEAERYSPHLVVCNEVTEGVLSSGASWMEILYTDSLKARASVGEKDLVNEDAGIDFLLAVLDTVQERLPQG